MEKNSGFEVFTTTLTDRDKQNVILPLESASESTALGNDHDQRHAQLRNYGEQFYRLYSVYRVT